VPDLTKHFKIATTSYRQGDPSDETRGVRG
jgi:hypothetical protein